MYWEADSLYATLMGPSSESIPYSIFILSLNISKCSSPNPLIMSYPVSSFSFTLILGSSLLRLNRIYSSSCLSVCCMGSMEQKNTGGGSFIPINWIGSVSSSSTSVSPDLIFLHPTMAPMSPTPSSATYTISSALILSNWLILST